MNWKVLGYIFAILLILVLIGGIGFTFMRTTEGYRGREQNFYTFEPHFGFMGGCAHYRAPDIQKTVQPMNTKKK